MLRRPCQLHHRTLVSQLRAVSVKAPRLSQQTHVGINGQSITASPVDARHDREGAVERPLKDPSTATKLVGLLAKQAALEKAIKRRVALNKTRASNLRKQAERAQGIGAGTDHLPPRLASSTSQPHFDLASFLDHAEKSNLKKTTTVYKGTLYEYVVAETLKAYGFSLNRVGKTNDLGIDLVGYWNLPAAPYNLRVLVQCKMSKPSPSLVRELEGAYAGAPTGWHGDNVLALLVSAHAATHGTQQAVQRSKWPIGFVQSTLDGTVKQLIWNSVASDLGLTGVGVTTKYGDRESYETTQRRDSKSAKEDGSLTLTWLGETWPSNAV